MTDFYFDTLKISREFERAGFSAKEAETLSRKLHEMMSRELVTRQYLDLRLAELRTEWLRIFVPMLLGQAGLIAALVKLT